MRWSWGQWSGAEHSVTSIVHPDDSWCCGHVYWINDTKTYAEQRTASWMRRSIRIKKINILCSPLGLCKIISFCGKAIFKWKLYLFPCVRRATSTCDVPNPLSSCWNDLLKWLFIISEIPPQGRGSYKPNLLLPRLVCMFNPHHSNTTVKHFK